MENEVWKDIPNFEGLYQVSNLGNVKSLKFNKIKVLKPGVDKFGYSNVNLYKSKKAKSYGVHRLVAMAFLNHIPCGINLVVDHINDNPKDNRLENLQVITHRENTYKTQGKYSSKYKGVNWSKKSNKWEVRIRINKNRLRLGYFTDEYEAHLVYENKLKEIKNGKTYS